MFLIPDALLADLQTTVSSPPGSLSRSSGYSSTYNGTSTGLAKQNETFDYNVERSVSWDIGQIQFLNSLGMHKNEEKTKSTSIYHKIWLLMYLQ